MTVKPKTMSPRKNESLLKKKLGVIFKQDIRSKDET